ncbi:MAG: hypothetical protein AAFY71_22205 [Bacteroidota bacterium]
MKHIYTQLPTPPRKTAPMLWIWVIVCAIWPMELSAQTHYNLFFANDSINASTQRFCIDVELSFDQAGKLGSSNFVFDFNPNVLSNPVLQSYNLSNPPFYQVPTSTQPFANRHSFNVELNASGFGDDIATAPQRTFLYQICFDLVSVDSAFNLTWYESGTSGTIVFLDDPLFTQLIPDTLQNFQYVPTLPDASVSWNSFTAVKSGNDAQLDWTTADEIQVSQYEVERSTNGTTYTALGQVNPTAGPTGTYQYTDANVVNTFTGTVYYRIKQTNNTGSTYYSPVDTIEIPVPPVDASVNWNSFTAVKSGNDAQLDWTTADEIQVSQYEVERSTNGTTYTALGQVNPTTGPTGTYQYTDANVVNTFTGTVYYRIKQTNNTGSTYYSPVDTIEIPVPPVDASVSWNNFTAVKSGSDAQLDWTTADEIQVSQYEVERSTNGTTYTALGQVNPTTGPTGTYQYTDANVVNTLTGTVYYRIKQTNNTGSTFYSPVDTIQIPVAVPPVDASVGWNSFTAVKSGNDAQLDWTTADEIQVSQYEVERSTNGTTYTALGQLNPTAGPTGTYQYTDANVVNTLTGTVYYRIKQTNNTGSTFYSPVDTIQIPVAVPPVDASVSWNSFTAIKSGNDAQLDWTTADEIQVSQYEVERSTNGTTYTALGQVNPTAGPTGTYQYTDANVVTTFTGTVYYRIKQTNNTGSTYYSPVDTIQIPVAVPPPPPTDTAVIWNSFTVIQTGVDAQLDWTSSDEVQVANYQIERSNDGVNFSTIGQVGVTTGLTGVYQYFDQGVANTFTGTVFYRIKQTNTSGSTFYSPVEAITLLPPSGNGPSVYNLSFANASFSSDSTSFCVDGMISMDQKGALGSSNFVFDYDPQVIDLPILDTVYISPPPFYQVPSLTQPLSDRISINIELNAGGFGDSIVASPMVQPLFKVCFDVLETDSAFTLRWFEAANSGTVVFSDDAQVSQLTPNNLEDFLYTPPQAGNMEVEWISFTATAQGNDALLQWTVSDEDDVQRYEIESSQDGSNFLPIGNIDVNPPLGSYQFVDQDALNGFVGTMYYRIKQLNPQGFFYSPIDSIEINPAELNWLSMEASLAFPDVMVSWSTTNESAITQYEAQRSIDGQNFTGIGIVDLTLSGGPLGNYQVVDMMVANTFSGIVYYRIKASTNDNVELFSPIDTVNLDEKPIIWDSLRAEKINSDVLLSWYMLDDTGIASYDIERSPDGQIFQRVGNVMGNGATPPIGAYQYTDFNVVQQLGGKQFYRIRANRNSGSFSHSPIVEIDLDSLINTPTLFSYPHPAAGNVRIQWDEVNTEVRLRLVNGMGQLVRQEWIADDQNYVIWDFTNVQPGFYIINLESAQGPLLQAGHRIWVQGP